MLKISKIKRPLVPKRAMESKYFPLESYSGTPLLTIQTIISDTSFRRP